MELLFSAIHHVPGQIGHFLAIFSFIAALLACCSFFLSVRSSDKSRSKAWKQLGRWSFLLHGVGIIAVMAVLFYIINAELFEYHYAWQHSSTELPVYYQIASFWEGQEGSFLLWAFWHAVLGVILILTAKKWEGTTMTFLSLAQVFIGSMILGIYVLGYKVGSSPFILLRDALPDAPIFQMNPEFVPADGSGLNPILQNYWMVIHPPVLFLGFASGIIPFCFAMGGLWTKKFKDWLKPAIPWTIFSVMALGTGIGMGAAWAYEALSFGGYWAWDPVENASLVPWLILLAGLHTALAAKNTGHALKTTFIVFIMGFVLILYATFLTRSGILGDTSVHSFTDLGMSGQLIVYLSVFFVLGAWLLIKRWKQIPVVKKEENIHAREFWMFIGALVLLLSSFQIVFDTSRPVINELFNTNLAPPTEPVPHYNRWQLPIGIIVGLLAGAIQFLRYRKTNINTFFKRISIAFVLALALTCLLVALGEIFVWHYAALLLAGLFAAIANLDYIITVLSGKLRLAGASFAHVGFGLLLVGVLFSSYKQHPISINRMGIDYGKGYDKKEKRQNILLYKGQSKKMGDYTVTYMGDTSTPLYTYFKVNYKRWNEKRDELEENFTLYPYIQKDKRSEMVASPATKRYLSKDVFTHVTSIPKDDQSADEQSEFKSYTVKPGDTIFLAKAMVVLDKINPNPEHEKYQAQQNDVAAGARLRVLTLDTQYIAEPVYYIRDKKQHTISDQLESLGLIFKFTKIHPQEGEMEIKVKSTGSSDDFIIMKAIVFPYINLVWLGIILMVIGFMTSLVYRYKQNKRSIAD